MKSVKSFFKIVKQELYILTSKQKKISIVLLMIVLIGSLLELLGVSAILPFIQSLIDLNVLKSNEIVNYLICFLKLDSDIKIIFTMAILMAMIYIIKNLFLLFSLKQQYKFRYQFQRELSFRMLSSYLKRPYEYFLNINSAQVLRSIQGDVIGVFIIYEYLFRISTEMLNIILIGFYLIYTDCFMAIGILALCGLCFIIITNIFRTLLKGVGDKQREADILVNKYAYQIVNATKEIHVMKKNNLFLEKYDSSYKKKSEMEMQHAFLSGCPDRFIEMSCVCGLILIVCIRVSLGVDLKIFIPKLSVFALAAFRILPSISKLITYINGLMYHRPALDVVCKQLRETGNYKENNDKEDIKNEKSYEQFEFKDKLEIRNVTWHYPGVEKNVLQNINVVIHKGETVGLIGASGAGKTTLSDLMLGLFTPQHGDILVDGYDLFQIPYEWARVVGYVPQNVYLTDDTIKCNIAFGVDEKDIDETKIWEVLEQAQLKDVVMQLPQQLETIVGERGIRFSGGQRQRIAIARALYHDPDVLVLDEATSALDNDTEEDIMEAIGKLQGNKTIIIVAHRLSTLKKCNTIYEVKDGETYFVEKERIFEYKEI